VAIPQELIDTLILSAPDRVHELRKARGGILNIKALLFTDSFKCNYIR
jgi:hypothetical protein